MNHSSLFFDSGFLAFLDQIKKFETLLIGYSGGLDSTVLLHVISEVLNKNKNENKDKYKDKDKSKGKDTNAFSFSPHILAIHINHHLSPNCMEWQSHCEKICRQWNIPLITKDVWIHPKKNIEEQARVARYDAFLEVMQREKNVALVLAHHQDDQAETLLLQLFRGTGVAGMAAMPFSKPLRSGKLFRPLLTYSRQKLEQYAKLNHLKWIEDESNVDINFSRNYLRHEILPLLKKRWPSIVQTLSRTSQHCNDAQENLEKLAKSDLPNFVWGSKTFPLERLKEDLPSARIVNILRLWIQSNQIKPPSLKLINQLQNNLILAKQDAQPKLYLGNHIWIQRYRTSLYIISESKTNADCLSVRSESKKTNEKIHWINFPQPLTLDLGKGLSLLFPEINLEAGFIPPSNAVLEIRFRQGGELFYWRGQNKRLKKLFQEWGVPSWQRDQIPLIYVNNQLAYIVGYAVSDYFYRYKAADTEKDLVVYQITNLST